LPVSSDPYGKFTAEAKNQDINIDINKFMVGLNGRDSDEWFIY